MTKDLEPYQLVERSIQTKFRKGLWNPFIAAVKRYALISPGDRIAVCISGGKDSMLMAKLMQMLQQYSETPFDLVYLVMDPGYNALNRQKIVSNAALLHIPITVFESNIFEVANSAEHSPCYLCAKMRRGTLYAKAKELGCSKIALGHHQDDIIHTTLLNLTYQAHFATMPVRLKMRKMPLTLIRPLCLIEEKDIQQWAELQGYQKQRKLCPYETQSHRSDIRLIYKQLEQLNPEVRYNIWGALEADNKLIEE